MNGTLEEFAVAVKNGDLDEVQRLAPQLGKNIWRSSLTDSLLDASQEGHLNIVAYLVIKQKVNVNTKSFGMTPLKAAVREGHKDVVKFLLENGAKIEDNSKWSRIIGVQESNLLIIACQKNYVEIVKLLLQHGADVHSVSVKGQTAFKIARDKGRDDILSLLMHKEEELDHATGSLLVFEDHDTWEHVVKTNEDPKHRFMNQIKNKESLQEQLESAIWANQRICELEKTKNHLEELEGKLSSQLVLKIEKVDSDIAKIKKYDPKYLSEESLAMLKSDIEGINQMEDLFGSQRVGDNVNISKECPICMTRMKNQVFCCAECNKWIGQECLKMIEGIKRECPNCRCDLSKKPMQRNRAIEQMLRQ